MKGLERQKGNGPEDCVRNKWVRRQGMGTQRRTEDSLTEGRANTERWTEIWTEGGREQESS